MRGKLLGALAVTAAALAAPGAANAATTLDLDGNRMTVTGDAFRNEIFVHRFGSFYRVTDQNRRLEIEPGSQCFFPTGATPPHTAECHDTPEVPVVVEAGAGSDEVTLVSTTLAATLDGEAGVDELHGGGGRDTIRGGPGSDFLEGEGGNDVLDGQGGADGMSGGPGRDAVDYGDRTARVDVTLAVDELDRRADDGNLTDGPVAGLRDSVFEDVEDVLGGTGPDHIVGNNELNRLHGFGGADELFGRAGDDLLSGGLGPDEFNGNDGVDRAVYDERLVPVTVTLDGLANDGNPTQDAGDRLGFDMEGAIGGHADDTLVGNTAANPLRGGPGDDRVEGREGADELEGREGEDRLEGGAGPDRLSGGDGFDAVTYDDRAVAVDVTLDGTANDGGVPDGQSDDVGADVESVSGTPGDDHLQGTDGKQILNGLRGNDLLEGLAGDDTLNGGGPGLGLFADGTDVLDGGLGADTASYANANGIVEVTLDGQANDGSRFGENDLVRTEHVIGSSFGDTIVGNGGFNRLSGGGGPDTLRGGGGQDFIDGGDGADALSGEDGPDTLLANDGIADDVDCGAGLDTAAIDLLDAGGRLIPDVLTAATGCETFDAAPAGQLPNVALASRIVRVRDGKAAIVLRCPRAADARCAGRVSLRAGGDVLGSSRFSIRRGGWDRVLIRLARTARAGGLDVVTREQAADGREKMTLKRARLRRA